MHTVDHTRKMDREMIEIICKPGRTADKLEETKKNLGKKTPKSSEKIETSSRPFRVQKIYQRNEKTYQRNNGKSLRHSSLKERIQRYKCSLIKQKGSLKMRRREGELLGNI